MRCTEGSSVQRMQRNELRHNVRIQSYSSALFTASVCDDLSLHRALQRKLRQAGEEPLQGRAEHGAVFGVGRAVVKAAREADGLLGLVGGLEQLPAVGIGDDLVRFAVAPEQGTVILADLA